MTPDERKAELERCRLPVTNTPAPKIFLDALDTACESFCDTEERWRIAARVTGKHTAPSQWVWWYADARRFDSDTHDEKFRGLMGAVNGCCACQLNTT